MPIFCYETEDGEVMECMFRVPPKTILINGKIAKRSYKHEGPGVPATSGWPITCYASGVNAAQADELRDYLKKKGVPTEVTPDGDPVYTSHAHRKRALKARGMMDRAGYN